MSECCLLIDGLTDAIAGSAVCGSRSSASILSFCTTQHLVFTSLDRELHSKTDNFFQSCALLSYCLSLFCSSPAFIQNKSVHYLGTAFYSFSCWKSHMQILQMGITSSLFLLFRFYSWLVPVSYILTWYNEKRPSNWAQNTWDTEVNTHFRCVTLLLQLNKGDKDKL